MFLFYTVFNVLYITPVYFCDLRAAAGSTDGKSERESSLRWRLLWSVRHLCCVKRGPCVWIWPLKLSPAGSVWLITPALSFVNSTAMYYLWLRQWLYHFKWIFLGTKSTKMCFVPVKLTCFKNSTTAWVDFSGGQHHTLCLDAEGKLAVCNCRQMLRIIC